MNRSELPEIVESFEKKAIDNESLLNVVKLSDKKNWRQYINKLLRILNRSYDRLHHF